MEVFEVRPEDFAARVEAAACYVESGGRLLLVRLGERKAERGKWSVPGGKLEKGEAPAQAAVRELWEETGIRAEGRVKGLGALYMRKPEVDYVFHMFKVELEEKPEVLLSEEHVGYRWVSRGEAEKMELMEGGKEALAIYEERRR